MNQNFFLFASGYLNTKDIDNLSKSGIINTRQHIEILKHSILERFLNLSDSQINDVNNITTIPPNNLDVGLYYRIFKPSLLKDLITFNEMLDPRTKVQLLLQNNIKLFNWFVDTFIKKSPKIFNCSDNIKQIISAVRNEQSNTIEINGYLFMLVSDNSIRVYNIKQKKVVAFAIDNTLFYIEDHIKEYFKTNEYFSISSMIYKCGEMQTLYKLLLS
jgi:hypothetical protein